MLGPYNAGSGPLMQIHTTTPNMPLNVHMFHAFGECRGKNEDNAENVRISYAMMDNIWHSLFLILNALKFKTITTTVIHLPEPLRSLMNCVFK